MHTPALRPNSAFLERNAARAPVCVCVCHFYHKPACCFSEYITKQQLGLL